MIELNNGLKEYLDSQELNHITEACETIITMVQAIHTIDFKPPEMTGMCVMVYKYISNECISYKWVKMTNIIDEIIEHCNANRLCNESGEYLFPCNVNGPDYYSHLENKTLYTGEQLERRRALSMQYMQLCNIILEVYN